jgi:hypothetical protein
VVVLEINLEKAKYMLLSHHQNAGQNWDIKIANKSIENMSPFKYLRTTVTNMWWEGIDVRYLSPHINSSS